MRTIRENLEEAIELFKTNKVMNHLRACELVYMDLSTIQNFPVEAVTVFVYYQKFLVEKHQSVKKVGVVEKILEWIHSRYTKSKLVDLLNKADVINFGDGDKYLKDIFLLVRKAI